MKLYIGIDLGTSSVKLLLLSEAGETVKTVSESYPVSYPQSGWSEQDPEAWVRRTVAGIRELLADQPAAAVRGIGVAGQMHGLVALDANGKVLRPAILWNDGRSAAETEELNRTVGTERLLRATGNIAYAGFTLPKLLWMRKHEPQIYAKIHTVLLPKDYLVYRLTGVLGTEPSDACGTLLYDVRNRCWSREIADACGIPVEWLPEVRGSAERVGTLLPEMARACGLSETVFAAAGAGDNAAAALGTGAIGAGTCNLSLGTSGTVLIPCASYPNLASPLLHTFVHADGNPMLLGCVLSAASCGQWWIEDILGTRDYAGEQAHFRAGGAGETFFLPYLMGERSPHNDPNAKGVFFGMRRNTTRAQLTQAVYEGVTFALRDSLEAAEKQNILLSGVRLCGGGAVSAAWRQMAADILNRTVEVPEQVQGPSLGGALLAAIADGVYSSPQEAAASIAETGAVYRPNPEAAAYYQLRYRFFRKLYPAMKPLFADAPIG